MLKQQSLKVQLPSYDIIEVDYYSSKNYNIKVIDIKNRISDSSEGLDPRRMRLLYKHKELCDDEELVRYGISSADTVQIVYKVINVDPGCTQFYFKEFVKSINPDDGSFNVPTSSSISLYFGPNDCGHFIKSKTLVDCATLLPLYEGNMLKYYGCVQEAARHGFVQWTDCLIQRKLILLKIGDRLNSQLESIRYNVAGINNGYCQGDSCSWQRYTKFLPIDCTYTIDAQQGESKEDKASYCITMQPTRLLENNTYYATMLCNNVPTFPVSLVEAHWMAFTSGGTCEDKLYIFKTEKKQLP